MIRLRRSEKPAPASSFLVVGDVHGRDDLLARAFARADEIGVPLISVGDVADRGPDSAAALRRLAERQDAICLMGNHEEMMIDFLDGAVDRGLHWLRHGGRETLESFGVSPSFRPMDQEAARVALVRAMGSDLVEWLRARPSYWISGNVAITHAGADPFRPLDAQDRELRWGHPDFGRRGRRDGLWIVHGHNIVPKPLMRNRIISIDTGAWATGRLTLALFEDGGLRFEST